MVPVKVQFTSIIFKDNLIGTIVATEHIEVVATMDGDAAKKVQLVCEISIHINDGGLLKILVTHSNVSNG